MMDDFLDELYETIADEECEELGINIEDENYKIINESQANFFLRRLSELNADNDKINKTCDDEIKAFVEKINSFRESKLNTNKGTIKFFSTLLERYAHSQLDGTKKKSLKLPFGTLQFKTNSQKLNYIDSEVILKTLEENDLKELIRTKKEIDKNLLKKSISIVDEKVFLNNIELQGIEVLPEETSFSVKIK